MHRWLVGAALAVCMACSGGGGVTVGNLASGETGGAGAGGSSSGAGGVTPVEVPDGGVSAGGSGLQPVADAGGVSDGGGVSGAGGGTSSGGNGAAAGATGEGGSAGSDPVPWPCPRGMPCVILPLGDSITFGYGSTTGGGYRVGLLSHALADKRSITFVGSQSSGPQTVSGQPFPKGNEGHSGYSIDDSAATRGISPLVDHALAAYMPNIILLMIGTNDMHYKQDVANAPGRLGALIDRITTDAPNALLVVAQIIPANGAQDALTQAYNASIPSVVQPRVAQGKHLALVDMHAALNHWSTALFKDSEHPNDAGYNAMADVWYTAIHTYLP